MSAERQQAIAYLRAPANKLWRWDEDGAVVVWTDGTTVAFREEIVEVLKSLAPNGLPPFGSIILLLAACRGKLPLIDKILEAPGERVIIESQEKARLLLTARRQLAVQIASALGELTKVSQLPSELNSGLNAKRLLAQAVFEVVKVERTAESKVILAGLREPLSDAELNPEPDAPGGNLVRQVQIVADGLKPLSAESLALRLRTGLNALPKEVDVELPAAERARRLIEELSRDREYGSVARAARELMAAVRLPRRLGEREELAIGGISDITNRGPLDKLLLSELAHDDLTLAARVALNEALYLRREPPMREPPGTLAVLLDSSIRLWGTPRVLAVAVGLALAACDKQHAKVMVWRAHGTQLKPVDLLSREGLIAHLSALETEPHCGQALPAFVTALPEDGQNQAVLITHADALNDAEFRHALAKSPSTPGFIATVDRSGRFELYSLPFARRQPLCEADLDLAAIFEEKPDATPLINPALAANLPAIFCVSPFPFLLPFQGRVDCWTKGPDGFTYAVLHDRRLVRFKDTKTGGRVLPSNLPPGKTVWMACQNGFVYVVKGSTGRKPSWLLSMPVIGGEPRTFDLESGSDLLAVHCTGETILVIRRHDIRAYSLATGQLLGRTLNHYEWVHGRYFRGKDRFWFPVWDGQHVKFEPLSMVSGLLPPDIQLVFDRPGVEGPWVVHEDVEVLSTVTGERHYIKLPTGRPTFRLETVKVSNDGNRVFAALHRNSLPSSVRGTLSSVLDLTTGKSQQFNSPTVPNDFDPPPTLPNWNLFRLTHSVALFSAGVLLRGRNERWRQLVYQPSHGLRILELQQGFTDRIETLSFAPCQSPPGASCSLQVANCPDGSRVFLDSRGLLHFKSADPSLPEISLVLSAGEVAAWTSDGFTAGPAFFFEETRPSEPGEISERLARFVSAAQGRLIRVA